METKDIKFPKTLVEAVRIFSDLDYATSLFAGIRWPKGVCCPHCGSVNVDYLPKRRLWQCRENHPRNQFSVKIGTVFEECRLPIDKCLIAIWLEVNSKNSISSYEIARHLGVTQKTAWFLLHRIRLALHTGTFDKPMGGVVEADETFVGGLAKNMHKHKRQAVITGTGGSNKTAVMGLLARHAADKCSQVRAAVIPNTKRETLHEVIYNHVEEGATIYTDAWQAYRNLGPAYFHDFVDHAEAYVKGAVHTNGLENFWCLFKRCIKGTHVNVEPFHLNAYVDSEAYRFNNREDNDGQRFVGALKGLPGKRLTYKTLIGDTSLEGLMASGSSGENQGIQN
jgi:transposase-like protein